ncbi:MAG: HEAT repeat domain-containing protein [Methanosarcina sp.]
MSEQPEIHDRTFSQVTNERIKAAKQLGALFEVFPERKQAFEDLLKLSSDRDNEVREEAIKSLTMVFPNIPDKELAWDKFVNLTAYPAERVMKAAVKALVSVFSLMPDRNKTWKDLVELLHSKTSMEDVNREIIDAFPYLMQEIPDNPYVWKDLLETIHSKDLYVREKTIAILSRVFPDLADEQKEKTWKEIFKLAAEPDVRPVNENIRKKAAEALIKIFPAMPEQMKQKAWEDFLKIATLENYEMQEASAIQQKVLQALQFTFFYVPDKERAWDELLKLLELEKGDKNKLKLFGDTLNSIAPEMPDKEKVWADFVYLLKSEDYEFRDSQIRKPIIDTLTAVFPHLEDENAAWRELLELAQDKDEYIKSAAAEVIIKIFPYLPDRKGAYEELASAARKKENYELYTVVKTLETIPEQLSNVPNISSFTKIPDVPTISNIPRASDYPEFSHLSSFEKEESRDLQGETKQKRKYALEAQRPEAENPGYLDKETIDLFSKAYPGLPDKDRIIKELVNLSSNHDPEIRKEAIEALLSLYSKYSGKTQDIWNELLTKTQDHEIAIRKNAAELLPYIFPGLEEKSNTFFELIKLTGSQDAQTRKRAGELLTSAFMYVEGKQKAWDELLRLTSVEDREVRRGAVLALVSGYPEVPDKRKGWRDLVRLSTHNDSFVQRTATRALGPAFFYAPDKTEAWRDLQVLTDNPYVYVRKYALRSLGRGSLWRALRAENEATYIFGLKEAVKYFKEASETAVDIHVPEFYHPFYEALLFILFSERPGSARLESERYLSKVTGELRDQPENKKLIEVLEEFAALLRSAGDIKSGNLSAQKKLLETSIQTFDKYSDFLENREEKVILTERPAKKGIPKPGKEILEKVERKKSFLLRKP